MRRLYAILFFIVATQTALLAQSGNPVLDQINAIKEQSDLYFWEEYNHPDPDTASVRARRWLLLHVNVDRTPELTVDHLKGRAKDIKMSRVRGGQQIYRIFTYVKKSDLDDIDSQSSLQQSAMPDPTLSSSTTPTAAPPTALAPMATMPREFVPEAFVQKVMQLEDFKTIMRYLRTLKADGQMLSFGPLKDVEDYSSLNLILFDLQTQKVITLFSPVIYGTDRVDLTTGAKDSLDDYPEDKIAVVWYIK